jgi:hypothetical protein
VVVQGDKLLVSTFRKAELLVVGDAGVVERLTPPRVAPAFNSFNKRGGFTGPVPSGVPGVTGDGLANPAVAHRLLAGPGQTAMMLHQRGVDSEIGTTPSAYSGGSCAGVVEATVTAFEPAPPPARCAPPPRC